MLYTQALLEDADFRPYVYVVAVAASRALSEMKNIGLLRLQRPEPGPGRCCGRDGGTHA